MTLPRSPAFDAILAAAHERILILDGAMGTQIQGLGLTEPDFLGQGSGVPLAFPTNHPQQGNNDLLILTQPEAIEAIHYRYAKAGAEAKLYPTQDEATADLQNGRIDALISDKFVVTDWMNGEGKDCCRMLGDVPGTETEAGIGLRKGDDALRESFNKAIDAIVADGTYKTIVAKYFPFDIY